MVHAEPGTVTWFAIEEGPSLFAIFDTFNDEAGRDAHLNGKVAAALMACFKAGTKSHTNKVELGRHGQIRNPRARSFRHAPSVLRAHRQR